MAIGTIDPRCVAPTNEPPKLTTRQAAARIWTPDAETWTTIKKHSRSTVTITGYRDGNPNAAVSRGQVTIRISADPVGAPIFYRDVPLMPSETEKGVIKPLAVKAVPLIAWRLRDVGETQSHLLMTGIHSCANCHSVSRDGKTMGMDVDGPQNDKGLYAIFPIKPQSSIRKEDVVAWSTFRGKLGSKLRVGFMSQVSPDGQYVVTTINDSVEEQSEYQRRKLPKDLVLNYYVANFKDYRFLQVFYPTRGILAWYSRATGRLQPLPGADDPRYVHTDAVWSPDGKYLVFARAEAKDAYPENGRPALYANDPNETQIQYDLYRIPFNDGRGGRPELIAGASRNGMSNSFPKVSPDGRWIVYVQARNGQLMRPDSRLYIVPAEGGTARRMQCNTELMNSWHSFSPNGRWMVFSSKSRSPYTQMFLTHLDEAGNDSPAILIENATAANRAVNIPEFVNVAPGGLLEIAAPVTEYYRFVDDGQEFMKQRRYEEAIAEWRKALELGSAEAVVHNNLGVSLLETDRVVEAIACFEKALELSPDYAEAHNNLGNALVRSRKLDEAIEHFEKALDLNAEDASAHINFGVALVQSGRIDEAIQHLQKGLDSHPDNADAHNNLGFALATKGRLDEAIPDFEKAVSLNGRSLEYRSNIGSALAAKTRFPEAILQLEEAVKLSGGRDPRILDRLAGVYAELGRFAQAVETARRALAVASEENDQQLVDALKARIASYNSRIAAPGR